METLAPIIGLTRKLASPNSAIVWSGISLLDGVSPIVVVATGLKNRRDAGANRKTGAMVQTYILRADMRPYAAILDGSDEAICGDCPHRRNEETGKRSCYVNPATGLNSVGKQLIGGAYPTMSLADASEACRGRNVRIGTYGDPMAVPAHVWRMLIGYAAGHTGYTHQWRLPHANAYRAFLMASCDSQWDRAVAKARGWRTFRVRGVFESGIDAMGKGEIVCPASAEGGHRVSCQECKLCAGASRPAKDIAIINHSTSARAAVKRLACVAQPATNGRPVIRKATQIGQQTVSGSGAIQRTYRLSEPMEGYYVHGERGLTIDHVVVSAVNVFGEPETYIFASDAHGTIVDWSELPGSFRGALDHDAALRNAGYTVETTNV